MEERIEKLENKINILLVLVSILIVLCLIILGNNSYPVNNNSTNDSSNTNTEANTSAYDVSSFNEINPGAISGFNKKETYVVYIGREGCSYCLKMIPNLKQAEEDYGYTTQYIDLAKIIDPDTGKVINNNAYTMLANLDTVESQSDVMKNLGSTPLILIIKDRKIIGSYLGYADYETFARVLEDNGLKKK